MTFLITHQTQPTCNTCFSTCLAMIKGDPAGYVVSQIHEWYFNSNELVSTRQALDRLEIPFESFDTADLPYFQKDGVYLVAVPSLNSMGWMHQILCEVFDGQFIVLDPCAGLSVDQKYYTATQTEDPSQVKLNGYVIDAFIPRTYLERRYSFKLQNKGAQ